MIFNGCKRSASRALMLVTLFCAIIGAGDAFPDGPDSSTSTPTIAQQSAAKNTSASNANEEVSELYLFLGRFHPLILHFPIGIVAVLFLFELIAIFKTSDGFERAIMLLLVFGWMGSIIAAVFGIFLSWSGGYNEGILFWHKWLGIGVAVLLTFSLILKWSQRRGKREAIYLYRACVLGAMAAIVLAGHNGAMLTHGTDYLIEYMPPRLADTLGVEKPQVRLAAASSGDIFNRKIRPIFEANCMQCHGEAKQKGGLLLTSRDELLQGGDSGKPAIVPGDPASSELVRRIMLPADHTDAMPPPGKGQLTLAEKTAIMEWVTQGAPWSPPGEGAALTVTDSSSPAEPSQVSASQSPVTPVSSGATETRPAVRIEVPDPAELDFATHVWPIFEARCVECHGPQKQKGNLRLDSPNAILSGGTAVMAGNPQESELYKRIILPADDIDVMPAQGDKLIPDHIEIIRMWIEQGADFGGWGSEGESETIADQQGPADIEELARQLDPLSKDELAALERFGVYAMPIAANNPLIHVDLRAGFGRPENIDLNDLKAVVDHVVWLSLEGRDLKDMNLSVLSEMKNLKTLYLQKSGVADDDLRHLSGLEKLEYLNLVGTQVSDAGLAQLEGLKSLEKLYLWNTKVSQEGVDRLASARPELKINMGKELEIIETEVDTRRASAEGKSETDSELEAPEIETP